MFNKSLKEWTINELIRHEKFGTRILTSEGNWEPIRIYELKSLISRAKLAWKVFNGDTDVLIWPNQNTNIF